MVELAIPVVAALVVGGLTLWTIKLSGDWVGAARAGWLNCLLALMLFAWMSVVAMAGAIFMGYPRIGPLVGPLIGVGMGLFVYAPTLETSTLRGLGIGIVASLVAGLLSAALLVAASLIGFGSGIVGVDVFGGSDAQASGGSRSAQIAPRLAQVERAARTLCECSLNHGTASAGYERCRNDAKVRVDDLTVGLTQARLSEREQAAFLRLSSQASVCAREGERYLALASARLEPGEGAGGGGARANATPSTGPSSSRPPYRYQTVATVEIGNHVGKLVRLRSSVGWTRRDELIEVGADTLVLRRGRAENFQTYAVSLSSIELVEVFDRWPR